MAISLINIAKTRLLDKIKAIAPGAWKVLVVDEHVRELIDEVLNINDILNLNVTVVDALQSPRAAEPSLPVLYLVTPTTQNVQRICADFAQGRKGYREVHVVFIDVVPDRLVELLVQGIRSVEIKNIEEVYLNFWPLESQVFTTRTPWSFFELYGPPGSTINQEIAMDAFEDSLVVMSRTIVNVLSTLEEAPLIRYYQPAHHPPLGPLANKPAAASTGGSTAPASAPQSSGGTERWRSALAMRGGGSSREREFVGDCVSKKLAEEIDRELEAYKKENPEFPKKSDPIRPQSILFVVDRSMDPVAPFLHEFTYQAMVNDLLPIKDGKNYRYQFQSSLGQYETKEAVFSDADNVWTDVRHLHMREAIEKLMVDFNAFLKENGVFNKGQGAVTMNDMKDMLAGLPQYQGAREKFSLHLSMAQDCMDLFETKKLSDTGMVEQNCATGVTPEGKTPKSLVDEMVPLLGDSSQVVSQTDKVRIIALYILYKDGVPDEDRRRLFQHAKLSMPEQDSVNNLVHLGLKVVRNPNEREGKKRLKHKPSNSEEDYELSRYKPVVRSMLEDHIANKLDTTTFPYLRNAPELPSSSTSSRPSAVASAPAQAGSLRSQRPNWHRAAPSTAGGSGGPGGREAVKQRIILFVAGGITYSEMRSAYQVGQALGKEVVIGSTHVITPETFLKDLRSLGRSGIGANPPNAHPIHESFPLAGVKPPRTPRERYQIALDKRLWTSWVPPPAPPPMRVEPPQPLPSKKGSFGGSSSSGGASGGGSSYSKPQPVVEEKKKKRGLFKF